METFGLFVMLAIAVIIYFLPLFIANARQHPSMIAIAALNLLAGWTFIGWLVALVWALTAVNDPKQRPAPASASPTAELYKLAELLEKGLLTQSEFEKEKAKLLKTTN